MKNYPVTREEMEEFKKDSKRLVGGRTFLGRDNMGNEMYAPTRKMKKEAMKPKKTNNRKTTKGRKTHTLYDSYEVRVGETKTIKKIIKSQFKGR